MKALLIVIVALFATTDARAEKVDWSQYLETKSDRPLQVTSSKPEAKPAKAKAKVSKKKAKASKQKARKGKAKRARRR